MAATAQGDDCAHAWGTGQTVGWFSSVSLTFVDVTRLLCKYSNMAPRLSEQKPIFGVVSFVAKSLLGIGRQKLQFWPRTLAARHMLKLWFIERSLSSVHHFRRRHGNRKFHVGLDKNQLFLHNIVKKKIFWHNYVFFPVFFVEFQKLTIICTFHKHTGLIFFY